MALPYIKEDAIGIINGINKIFFTTVSYKSNSLSIFLNGQLQSKGSSFNWTENGLNKFTLTEAPLIGDKIKVGYIPT